ncbi:MAG: protein-export chaperone SecB [Pseudomonadota bacterium]
MTDQQAPQKQFAIQKLYVKDASYESPNSPEAFTFQKWEPKIDLNLNNSSRTLDNGMYEAVLRITLTATHEEKTAFLVEVHYAGLFAINGFDDKELQYILSCQCMNILFPYAREVISDMTVRGGFPPVVLSPVNFDALYQQHLQAQAEKAEGEATH